MVQATAEHAATDGAVNDLIERVARAIYAVDNDVTDHPFNDENTDTQFHIKQARAAIEAMRPTLEAARTEIKWWVDEHRCCAGKEEETMALLDAALGTAER